MDTFSVWIPGTPQAKGRPRFRVFNGRVHTYTPKTTQAYEQLIAEQIRKAYPDWQMFEGPVELDIAFHMPVPKSMASKFRYHDALTCPRFPPGPEMVGSPAMLDELWSPCKLCKPNAIIFWVPRFHVFKPDLDNLEKSVMDGLQMSEAIRDDSQVMRKLSQKIYSPTPGVQITMNMDAR